MIIIFVVSAFLTFACLYLLYRDLYVSVMGMFLYTLMPYRIYIIFDKKDMGLTVAYTLLPILFFCYQKLLRKNVWAGVVFFTLIVLMLEVIGYFDTTFLILLCCALILCGTISKHWSLVTFSVFSVVLSVPLKLDYWRFLLLGHNNEFAVSLSTIAVNGYEIGDYFMSWLYREGRPGLGFGFLISIMLSSYLYLCTERRNDGIQCNGMFVSAIILMIFSFRWGMWDIVARVHPIIFRFISLMDSPGVLFGIGTAILSFPLAVSWVNYMSDDTYRSYSRKAAFCTVVISVAAAVNMIRV